MHVSYEWPDSVLPERSDGEGNRSTLSSTVNEAVHPDSFAHEKLILLICHSNAHRGGGGGSGGSPSSATCESS